jgi:hypothetical protein
MIRQAVVRRGYMEQWINLYRASHSLEAHALKGALEVEGVRLHPALRDGRRGSSQ